MSKFCRIARNRPRRDAAKPRPQNCRIPGGLPLIAAIFATLLAATTTATAQNITIANAAALAAALQQAQGGETLVLAPGDYGDVTVRRSFIDTVTLTAAEPYGARFGKLEVLGGGGLRFQGIETEVFSAVREAIGIELLDSRVRALSYFRNVSDITLERNDLRGQQHALLLNTVKRFTVRGNLIHNAIEDLMRVTGDSHDGVIEYNRFFDMHPEDHRAAGKGYTHSDALQMFAVDGKTPRSIVIRRNHIYDDPATGAPTVTPQGIFLSDAGPEAYRDIRVEENLIAVRSANSIYVNGGQHNVVIRNNSLIPGPQDGGAVIRLANKHKWSNGGTTVTGNVVKIIHDESKGSTVSGNHAYGRNAALARLFAGTGRSWQDFLPPKISPIALGSGLGAEKYLQDLLEQDPG